MLFIILSISIDYGILWVQTISQDAHRGILYSLLSTFAGFGVLIFSDINALFSLGIVSTTGILAITFLLIILKRQKNDSKSI
jgi:predicted exporter